MPNQIHPKVLNWASIIEQSTIDQAIETASMPFVHPHLALMADAHAGRGSAVGTVIPTKGAVMPSAVGQDVGCGMEIIRTRLTRADLESRMESSSKTYADLRRAVEDVIPMSMGNYNSFLDGKRNWYVDEKLSELEERAERDRVDLGHSPKWREQLGTLGGSNHFIEVTVDEEQRVWLFLHSGSRGVGAKIAQKHIKTAQALCKMWHVNLPNPDLAFLPEGVDEFWDYIRELRWAQRFASLNRAEMMDRFEHVFADWAGVEREGLRTEEISCHHNYTEQVKIGKDKVWLTRKGAINAEKGARATIPGSMGSNSYVVTGKGNPASMNSAPHGAGRVMSRSEARKKFTQDDLRARMSGIEFRSDGDFVDEIPDSYKDVTVVMRDSEDLVSIDHTLNQLVSIKGE